jgi:hypothetical protein
MLTTLTTRAGRRQVRGALRRFIGAPPASRLALAPSGEI